MESVTMASELARLWQQASNVKLLRQPPPASLTAKQVRTYDQKVREFTPFRPH
jgi:hypothetical protein